MSYTTYYLGAGASANCLPLYSNFKIRLEVFRDFIYHYIKYKTNKNLVSKSDLYLKVLDELIVNLDDKESSTLDALANELYLKRGENSLLNFSKLKYLVSDFFVFEQLQKDFPFYKTQAIDVESLSGHDHYDSKIVNQVNTHVDKRYRSFITSELQANFFPSKINFISWNYDVQLEMGYRRIQGYSFSLAQNDLQVFPSPGGVRGIDINKSTVIKLNGTAGIYYSDNKYDKLENFIDGDIKFNESYIDYMIEIFYNNSSRIMGGYPFFTFSFEKERRGFAEKAIAYAKEIINRTDSLIVIGYSFHPLNREVDKKVFEVAPNLKSIIIQVPSNSDFEQIRYNLSKIVASNIRIEHNPNVNEFHSSNNV